MKTKKKKRMKHYVHKKFNNLKINFKDSELGEFIKKKKKKKN